MLILLCVSVMNELRPTQRNNVGRTTQNTIAFASLHYTHSADDFDTHPVHQMTTEGLVLFLGSSRIRHTD